MEKEDTDKKSKAYFPPELLDQLIEGAGGPGNVAGPEGLLKRNPYTSDVVRWVLWGIPGNACRG